ncbi:MAG: RNA pseudouridine synthase [Sphaerochaetaceae bacterium]|nr:RNA pseudouridine synthase [Sphaerochaetaceae bacterium]
MDIQIIKETTDFLVVFKPSELPTVPLKTKSKTTLLELVAKDNPEILNVKGFHPWEGGVLHRLDTATQGLVLIAKTQAFFDFIKHQQHEGKFFKEYYAKLSSLGHSENSWPECPYSLKEGKICISSYFRAFGKNRSEVRPALASTEKNATQNTYDTMIKSISEDEVLCQISKGFRHQIRCHLAWMGHPIKGDLLYSEKQESPLTTLNFSCSKLFIPEYGPVSIDFPTFD